MDTITISKTQYNHLINRITSLELAINHLGKIISRGKYGSKAWWKQELSEAEQELKSGKGKLFDNPEELISYLKNLPHADQNPA